MNQINETKQRFLNLKVDEISLVDNPANEEEWLIVKNLEDKSMDTANIEAIENPENEVNEGIEKNQDVDNVENTDNENVENTDNENVEENTGNKDVEVEKQKKLSAAMANKILKQILDIVSSYFKEYPEAKNAKKANPDAMMVAESIYNLLKPYFAKGYGYPNAAAYPEAKKTSKSLIVLDNDIVDIFKAKHFTKDRIEKMSGALKAMIDLLKEVDPDGLKKLNIEELIPMDEKETKKNEEVKEKKVSENDSSQTEIVESLKEIINKTIEPIVKRLDDLENTRGKSKSLDEDQTAEVKKDNEENVWGSLFR